MSITNYVAGMGVPGGDGTIDGCETSARGEALQARFGRADFLEFGKQNGDVWFEIPDHVRQMIISEADDGGGPTIIAAIESFMAKMNAFLARGDVSDTMKMQFLQQMFGTSTADYDDDQEGQDAWRGLGTVLAEAMVGEPDTIDAMFDTACCEVGTDFGQISLMISSATDAATKFMNDNKIDPEPDKSIAYLSSLSLLAEAEAKRRKGMTSGELIEDILRSRSELRADIESRKRAHAAGAPTAGPAA